MYDVTVYTSTGGQRGHTQGAPRRFQDEASLAAYLQQLHRDSQVAGFTVSGPNGIMSRQQMMERYGVTGDLPTSEVPLQG